MRKKLFTMLFIAILSLVPFIDIFANIDDDIRTIAEQVNNLNKLLQGKEADYEKANKQLQNIKKQLINLEQEIVKKEKEVSDGEKALLYQKTLLNERAKSYYKNISKNSNYFINLLVADNLSASLENFFYQKAVVDEDRNTIIKIVLYIKDLEKKRTELVNEKNQLSGLKAEVDKQTKILAKEISTTRQKIAELSAKQQQLIAQKLASLNISRSAASMGRCDSDLTNGRDPGFSPKFALFTYGVPHRNGLNQYGAWGRAKDGQNEEQILQEYYPGLTLKKDYDQNAKVKVDGYGEFSIEDYVKRIYEVPDSWTDNNLAVLKAQAVAARSYALNSMQRNGSICASESCQVFKSDPKGGNWEQAVESTKGWVLMDGGNPAFTQYASTHGGYILSINKFDGKDGNPGSFSELNSRAYDRDSPWFYCDWGSRGEYNKTAWLKPEEIADIVNVLLLAKADSSVTSHLSQEDKPNPDGTDTWSKDKVKQELRSRNLSVFNSISDIGIDWDKGSGKTTNVRVSGDGGSYSFDGGEFKNFFNLRAPANIQIVGPLYNAEKR